ncbi:MAG: hypothetical protein AAGF86_13300 [Pseudomonadota bacterium]
MSKKVDYGDEQLTAYLDGEVTREEASALESALEQDPALRKRLDGLRIDTEAIRQAGEALLASAPAIPDELAKPDLEAPGQRTFRLPAIAAVALLCFLAGAGLTKLLFPTPEETWQDFAAIYHALYVANTLNHIEQNEAAAEAELVRVSGAIGKTINLSELKSGPLDYKRAQILGYKGKPLLQLAFLSKIGAPVALCIYRSGDAAKAAVAAATLRGLSSATWSKDGYEYLLIGGTDQKLITDAAKAFALII